MRIFAIAVLISLAWTLFAQITEFEGPNTTHPTSLGLAVVGVGTLAAYEWLRRRDARRATSPQPIKQAFDAVAERYNQAKAEIAGETATDKAEHAA
jgi:hypothetical protein